MAIKKAIDNGEVIDGAKIVTNYNMQVKWGLRIWENGLMNTEV